MAVGVLAFIVLVGVAVLAGVGVFVAWGGFVGSGVFSSARVLIGGTMVVVLVGSKVDVGSRPTATGCIGLDRSFTLPLKVLIIR